MYFVGWLGGSVHQASDSWFNSGHDLRVIRLSPASGSMLSMKSAWYSLPLSLLTALPLSLSNKINKVLKKCILWYTLSQKLLTSQEPKKCSLKISLSFNSWWCRNFQHNIPAIRPLVHGLFRSHLGDMFQIFVELYKLGGKAISYNYAFHYTWTNKYLGTRMGEEGNMKLSHRSS